MFQRNHKATTKSKRHERSNTNKPKGQKSNKIHLAYHYRLNLPLLPFLLPHKSRDPTTYPFSHSFPWLGHVSWPAVGSSSVNWLACSSCPSSSLAPLVDGLRHYRHWNLHTRPTSPQRMKQRWQSSSPARRTLTPFSQVSSPLDHPRPSRSLDRTGSFLGTSLLGSLWCRLE